MKFNKINSVVDVVEFMEDVLACYLLGSAARDELRFESDVDLALLFRGGQIPDGNRLRVLSTLLSETAGRVVDLGVISSRNLVYAHQAVYTGKCIYMRDKPKVQLIISSLMGLYSELQYERAEVLHAYTA